MTALPRNGHPFTPLLVPPRHFVGRAAELAVFEALLEGLLLEGDEPPVLAIEGLHGLGRSALLRQAHALALSRGFERRLRGFATTWGWTLQAEDERGHALILVDDADQVNAHELARVIESLMGEARTATPDGGTLLMVLAGLPGTARRLGEAGLSQAILPLPLGPLSPAESVLALTEGAADFDEAFSQEALTELASRSQGVPVFLQIRGEVLWRDAAQSPIDLPALEAAEESTRARLDEAFFAPALARATRAERGYLAAAAALVGDGGTVTSGQVEARLLAGRAGRIDGGLRRGLLAKGLLYSPVRGELAFAHPGLAAYLCTVAS